MAEVSDGIAAALHERGMSWSLPRTAPEVSALDAWRYVARASVQVHRYVRRSDRQDLEPAFLDLVDQVGLALDGVVVSFGADASPWVEVDLADRTEIVDLLSLIGGQPSFLLASPTSRVLLAVDTEEWDYWLIAASWSPDGVLSPIP